MTYKIQWENRYSHEIGLVGDIDRKNKHFINAQDEASAKTYKTRQGAEKAVKFLFEETTEAINNDITVIEVE